MLNTNREVIDLQIFADGGATGASAPVGTEGSGAVTGGMADSMLATSKKGSKDSLENVKYGKQEDTTADKSTKIIETDSNTAKDAPIDRNAEFEKLIKGEYKDLYDAKMQDTVQKRLKASKEIESKYNELAPLLKILSKKHGVDSSDAKALLKAVEEDDSYFEKEAVERGMSVEQLKTIRKMENENADLRRQMHENEIKENADRLYATWLKQSESTKQVYPTFDLQNELTNSRFVDLIRNNIDVRTAYEVTHKDEIIHGAMQFATQQTEQQVVNKIRANGNRPSENGIGSQSSAVVKSDPSQLKNKDLDEILRRVRRGEKISF